MSNISNERLEEMAAEDIGSDVDFESSVMARELLEYRNASREPVVWMNRFTGRTFELEQQPGADKEPDIYIPLYAAPQPVDGTIEMLAKVLANAPLAPSDSQGKKRS